MFSAADYDLLKAYYYNVYKVGRQGYSTIYAQGTNIAAILAQENIQSARVGEIFSFVDVKNDSVFKEILQRCKFQFIQLSSRKSVIKAVTQSRLMPLGWAKRAIRLFYFEVKLSSVAVEKLFIQWASERFPS